MLMLDRRRDQDICLGHGATIVVRVLSIRGQTAGAVPVRLGIVAPPAVPIRRAEQDDHNGDRATGSHETC